jgi:hypothetical protein
MLMRCLCLFVYDEVNNIVSNSENRRMRGSEQILKVQGTWKCPWPNLSAILAFIRGGVNIAEKIWG